MGRESRLVSGLLVMLRDIPPLSTWYSGPPWRVGRCGVWLMRVNYAIVGDGYEYAVLFNGCDVSDRTFKAVSIFGWGYIACNRHYYQTQYDEGKILCDFDPLSPTYGGISTYRRWGRVKLYRIRRLSK